MLQPSQAARRSHPPHRAHRPLCTRWCIIFWGDLCICKYIQRAPSRGPSTFLRSRKDPDGHPADGHRRSTASVSVTHHHEPRHRVGIHRQAAHRSSSIVTHRTGQAARIYVRPPLVQRKVTSGPPARRDRRLSRSCTGDDPAMSEPSKLARRAY